MKRVFLVISVCVLVILSACKSGGVLDELSCILGVDLRGGAVVTDVDTHGGFHGDGQRFLLADYSDAPLTEDALDNGGWRALPLTENLTVFVYGVTTPRDGRRGPYLTDEDRNALFPPIANGFYYFLDRQGQGEHRRDNADLFRRYSQNVTLAIYDTDADMLYFVKLDT